MCYSFSSKEQESFNFMAAVTIQNDFGAQEKKACHSFPFYLPWSDEISCQDLSFVPGSSMGHPIHDKVMQKRPDKQGLNLNIQKTKIMASGPITSWETDGKTVEAVSDFIFWGSKITADGTSAMKLKDAWKGKLWPT